jgi:hypothetical protein
MEELNNEHIETRTFGFEIIISGNSGNCSINRDEEELIKEEIAKVLQNRAIDDFHIIMRC